MFGKITLITVFCEKYVAWEIGLLSNYWSEKVLVVIVRQNCVHLPNFLLSKIPTIQYHVCFAYLNAFFLEQYDSRVLRKFSNIPVCLWEE